jgi:ribosome biogenesis protein SSF1/2
MGVHNKVPDLSRCNDISEYFDKNGDASESEAEDASEAVEVKQNLSARGTKGLDEVAIKLVELGPRITMQLIKVEDGLAEGEILYHKLTEKTADEKLLIRQKRNLRKRQKEGRKREQSMNVERKKKEKLDHKQRCLDGMGFKPKEGNPNDAEDDDVDWYRKEVGQEPDEGTFSGFSRPKPNVDKSQLTTRKRFKRGDDGYEPGVKRQKVSKFAKVKEKAKFLKKERQKAGMAGKGRRVSQGTGGFKGRSTGFKGGSGTYSKPSKGRMSKKKM